MDTKIKKDFPTYVPFLKDVGAELVRMEGGEAEISLLLEERHANSFMVAHGGVVMTLLDVVMSMAARSLHVESHAGITIEMKTSFMQPAGSPGKRIVARGRVVHQGKSMSFCEGEVLEGDKTCAKASGTFKLVKRLDAAKRLERD